MSKFLLVTVLGILIVPCIAGAEVVRMVTNEGNVDIELYNQGAPITCANFLNYVNSGRYDNSMIHRSVPGFVVQGGGLRAVQNSDGTWGVHWIPTDPPIVNEFSPSRSNVYGTIAMAKQGGDPNSATSQWFFNMADNSQNLDNQNGGFTVFGHVIAGLNVVQAIGNLNVYDLTGGDPNSPYSSVPTLDTYTQAMYNAGTGPSLSDLVWVYYAYLFADANGDGTVDSADYIAWKEHYGTTSGATWAQGDFNGDGKVDSYDLYLLQFSMGQSYNSSLLTGDPSVPEPATLSLLGIGFLGLLGRRRRKHAQAAA